jgi:hypothetical protein
MRKCCAAIVFPLPREERKEREATSLLSKAILATATSLLSKAILATRTGPLIDRKTHASVGFDLEELITKVVHKKYST